MPRAQVGSRIHELMTTNPNSPEGRRLARINQREIDAVRDQELADTRAKLQRAEATLAANKFFVNNVINITQKRLAAAGLADKPAADEIAGEVEAAFKLHVHYGKPLAQFGAVLYPLLSASIVKAKGALQVPVPKTPEEAQAQRVQRGAHVQPDPFTTHRFKFENPALGRPGTGRAY
jgi:hypothetical protein